MLIVQLDRVLDVIHPGLHSGKTKETFVFCSRFLFSLFRIPFGGMYCRRQCLEWASLLQVVLRTLSDSVGLLAVSSFDPCRTKNPAWRSHGIQKVNKTDEKAVFLNRRRRKIAHFWKTNNYDCVRTYSVRTTDFRKINLFATGRSVITSEERRVRVLVVRTWRWELFPHILLYVLLLKMYNTTPFSYY